MKIITKSERIEAILIIALLLASVISMTGFAEECERISDEVLRLHVIANSDSDEDQALKLKVRDAVLKAGEDIFDGSVTADDAEKKIQPKTEELREVALGVLRENGCDSDVKISITEEYFDTRVYEKVTMPAGKYRAVRIVIGEGEGKNWWCVMFPPLCLPAAEAVSADAFFDDGEMKVLGASPEYEPRFKLVEIYCKIADRLERLKSE